MKKTLLKITLLLIAAITASSVNAATETYDFTGIGNNKWTTSSTTTVTTGGNTLNMLEIENNTFGNRFAVSRAGTTNTGGWCLKQYNTQDGLFSQYDERYLSVLNLKDGDKVTVTWFSYNEAAGKLKFYTAPAVTASVAAGDEVVSGTTYTISTDEASVNLDFVTAKASSDPNIVIQQIVIETASVSVPVTINVIPNATTEEYDFVTNWYGTNRTYIDTADPLTVGTNSFGNRFSVSRVSTASDAEGGFIIRGYSATEKGLFTRYEDRNFTIKNLKAGDKIVITWHCANDKNTSGDGKFVFIDSYPRVKVGAEGSELAQNTEVTSGQEYIVTRDNVSVAIRAKKGTSNTDPYVSITAVKIYPVGYDTGTYIGATLVSDKALDFTDVNDITAYVATKASAGSVTFSPVTKVAANTPLYIKANEESGSVINVNVPEATEGAVDYSATNLLKGSATSQTSLQSTTNKTYYVFGVKGNEAGFYPVSSSSSFTSAAGKAYLELTDGQAAHARAIEMNFVFDAAPTGIATVRQTMAENVYYNISGQRVANPTKGLYIVNGKKVIK